VRDPVDEHVAVWSGELPWLDPVREEILARMFDVTRRLSGSRAEALRDGGLALWQFKTLLMLRRAGEPYELNPSRLAEALGITRGALSGRLATLEERGYVEREHGTGDRRLVTVRLTAAGNEALEHQLGQDDDTESRLFATLTAGEQRQLAALLRKLTVMR
jgi:DNA-binding MarR family transcriptional regulator